MQGNSSDVIRCEAPVLERRIIRDSGGHEELRYVIETVITIGDNRLIAEVTLTDRDSMKFRALLGRTAISGHYLVDCSHSYLVGKRKKKRRHSNSSSGK